MISERSCETDCNDAEILCFDHRNKLHFKIYSNRKQLFLICENISQLFLCTHTHILGGKITYTVL